MKFTKEEIRLCKQIACRHRKKIVRGDRYVHISDKRNTVILSSEREPLTLRNYIPLWTISDCLEFLRDKGYSIVQACEHPTSHEWMIEVNPYHSDADKKMGHNVFDVKGDTFLIACLKAVLSVLEEKK